MYVRVPEDLKTGNGAVWVLDDGESMDLAGLHALWAVATSSKRDRPAASGRPQIGKFGLGKLATYVLADQLTYVCRGRDGVIRAVTMDYRRIHAAGPGQLSVPAVELDVRELEPHELRLLLSTVATGNEILGLIDAGVPTQLNNGWESEFGEPLDRPAEASHSWVLAVLTSLKPPGLDLQPGVIRWILRTSLPLGVSMAIAYNGEVLAPSKVATPVAQEWVLGPGLGLGSITVDDDRAAVVTEHPAPYPHLW